MNVDYPHEIVRGPLAQHFKDRMIPLTEAQAKELEALEPDARARWLAKQVPFKDVIRSLRDAPDVNAEA